MACAASSMMTSSKSNGSRYSYAEADKVLQMTSASWRTSLRKRRRVASRVR